MKLIYAMILGFILDLILGDPRFMIHPVQIIGWFIDRIKNGLLKLIYGCSFEEVKEQNMERKVSAELLAGYVLTLVIVLGTFFAVNGIVLVAGRIHPWLAFAVETWLIYRIMATKSLKKESMKVYYKLKAGDLEGARKEISYLVGRDTQELSESEIAKADVETIAENTADGVIAPLFFCAISEAAANGGMKRLLCIRQNHCKCNRLLYDGISTTAATAVDKTRSFKLIQRRCDRRAGDAEATHECTFARHRRSGVVLAVRDVVLKRLEDFSGLACFHTSFPSVDGIIAQPSAPQHTGLVHFFQPRSGARPTCRRAQ